MAFFKDDIITEKKEVKDTKTPGIKDLVSGNIITKEAISKQIPYIVFIAFIGILYIGNRYHAEKIVRDTAKLQKQVKELRSESLSAAAELMFISKQSEVIKLVNEKGMTLEQSVVPPKIVEFEE